MSRVSKILLNKKDLNVQFKKIKIKNLYANSYICERKNLELTYNIISKYIIIDLIDQEEVLTKLISSDDMFKKFQEENIAPVFFNHRDDIRWNIYTIFVIKNDECFKHEITYVERNEDYARKFVFNLDELDEFIEYGYVGKLNEIDKKAPKTNFVLEWEEILAEEGLSGCVYNKIKEKSVLDYIEKSKKINPIGRPAITKKGSILDSRLIIKHINHVNIVGYRSHCLGEKFNYTPSDINLLSGSNGTGKTSLCEALELGLTGKINGNKVDKKNKISINCINTYGSEINFKSIKTLKEERDIDLAWYGTTTTGNNSRLNENFSIFNYLNANAVLKVTDGKTDLNKILKNLIYGEETTEAKAKIENFENKFQSITKRLIKERKKIIDDISKIKENINRCKKEEIDLDFAEDQFKKIGIDYEYGKISYDEKIKKAANSFLMVKESVHELSDYLKNNEHEQNYSEIMTKNTRLKNEIIIIKKEIIELEEKIEIIKRASNEREKINYEMKKLLNKIIEYKNCIINLKKEKYKLIDNRNQFNQFINEYFQKMNESENLGHILKEYQNVLYLEKEPIINRSEYVNVNNEIINIKKRLVDLTNIIEKKKEQANVSVRLKANILELGRKYLSDSQEDSKCPLCGFEYTEKEKLYDAINESENLFIDIDREINEFNNKRENAKSELKYKEEIRDENDKKIIVKEKINEMKILLSQYFDDNLAIPPIDILNKINYKFKLDKDYLFANLNLYKFAQNINTSQVYEDFRRNTDFSEYSIYLKEMFNQFENKYKQMELKSKKLEKDILAGKELLNILKVKIEVKESKLKQFNLNARIIEHLNNIKIYFSNINTITNLNNWIVIFSNLDNLISDLQNRLIMMNNIQVYNERLMELENEHNILRSQINRCDRALNTFKRLPSLENNMQNFINENASRIEKIFKLVHRPKEFTDINIDNGKITFVRESTGEKTNISEISTGQGVSLTFSIMLCLYLSAENSPKIIILDEPVANMDDMHIMNLIDIIRELALQGTQIFITTANNQVAMLLRRKFSFFGKSFKHVIFERDDNSPSKIKEISYSPYKESPIKLIDLSS